VKKEQRDRSRNKGTKKEQRDRSSSAKKEQRDRSRSKSGKKEHHDRSRSRSGSARRRNRSRSGRKRVPEIADICKSIVDDEKGLTILEISPSDAAFVLGRGGKTKQKIAKVSGAKLDLWENDKLEIRGTKEQRRKGEKYCKAVMATRHGVVKVSKKDDDGDMTILHIPQDAVGFVTGRQGNFLRTLEEEWRVLMLFVELDRGRGKKDEELVIFGDRRGRRGAELKALSAVESKCPGFFEQSRDEILYRDQDDDWGVSTMEFKTDELAYALGKGGATRIKVEASSGCITQYLGHTAIFAGTREERKIAKEYMGFLFDQLDNPVYVKNWKDRDDCCVLKIPQDCVGYVTGSRRAALGKMEQECGVLMFFMGAKEDEKPQEELIIFGPMRSRKNAQLKVMSTVETKARGFYTSDVVPKRSTNEGFDVDIEPLEDAEVSYALGSRGSTRKKLELSSGTIIQYIGCFAFIAGDMSERRRASDYLRYLLDQRQGQQRSDWQDRDDVTLVPIPRSCISFITASKGQELRRVEEMTKTFCFLAPRGGSENVVILGKDEGSRYDSIGRMAAQRMLEDLISDAEHRERDMQRRRQNRRYDSRSRRGYRGRSPSPPRYDSRARDRSRGRGRRGDSRDSRR